MRRLLLTLSIATSLLTVCTIQVKLGIEAAKIKKALELANKDPNMQNSTRFKNLKIGAKP